VLSCWLGPPPAGHPARGPAESPPGRLRLQQDLLPGRQHTACHPVSDTFPLPDDSEKDGRVPTPLTTRRAEMAVVLRLLRAPHRLLRKRGVLPRQLRRLLISSKTPRTTARSRRGEGARRGREMTTVEAILYARAGNEVCQRGARRDEESLHLQAVRLDGCRVQEILNYGAATSVRGYQYFGILVFSGLKCQNTRILGNCVSGFSRSGSNVTAH